MTPPVCYVCAKEADRVMETRRLSIPVCSLCLATLLKGGAR